MMLSLPFSNKFKGKLSLLLIMPTLALGAVTITSPISYTQAQTQDGRALTVTSDRQEANTETGIITATGNVRIVYPARQIQATAAQAQYFSQGVRRLVLMGNVYVLQEGNSIQAETVTYLIDEGRFVAEPRAERQVQSIYLVDDAQAPTNPPVAPQAEPFNPKPAFKNPESGATP